MLDLRQGLAAQLSAGHAGTIHAPVRRTRGVKILLAALSSVGFVLQKRQRGFLDPSPPQGRPAASPRQPQSLCNCPRGRPLRCGARGRR